MTARLARPAAALLAAAALAGATAATAAADSIVYVKDGNVWLTTPDGSRQFQVTFDGDYGSPSQADDGTIVALRHKQLVRMDRYGTRLGAPVDAMGSPGTGDSFFGPYDPQVSPDGSRIAYWFTQYQRSCPSPSCQWVLRDRTAWTWGDRFTNPAAVGWQDQPRTPSWIGGDRLLMADIHFDGGEISWWALGGDPGGPSGDGRQWDRRQWWFNDPNTQLEYPELSADGRKLVVATGPNGTARYGIQLYTVEGSPWLAEPPYDNYDPNRPRPQAPVARCASTGTTPLDPFSWSPASDAVAYAVKGDGLHVLRLPDIAQTCEGAQDSLIVPGGEEPDWGPAGVPASRPAQPGGGGGAPGGGGTGGQTGGGAGGAPGGATGGAAAGTTATHPAQGRTATKRRAKRKRACRRMRRGASRRAKRAPTRAAARTAARRRPAAKRRRCRPARRRAATKRRSAASAPRATISATRGMVSLHPVR